MLPSSPIRSPDRGPSGRRRVTVIEAGQPDTDSLASLEEGESFTTLQLQSQFLRPVRGGRLVAEARVVHRGRQVGVVDCEVADADGRPVARVTSTCLVLWES